MGAGGSGEGGEVECCSVEPEGGRCGTVFGEGGGEEGISFLCARISMGYVIVRCGWFCRSSLLRVDQTGCRY